MSYELDAAKTDGQELVLVMRNTDPTRIIREQGPAHVTAPYQPESPTNSSFYPARNELWVIPGFELLGRIIYAKNDSVHFDSEWFFRRTEPVYDFLFVLV